MYRQIWVHEGRNVILCVDSYNDGVLKGRIVNSCREVERFSSLSQFLLKMEEILDRMQLPQAYTSPRSFSALLQPEDDSPALPARRGAKATFELKVIFRQHTSWQGVLTWREQKTEHSFRSVLELVILLDSALRSMEGSVVA